MSTESTTTNETATDVDQCGLVDRLTASPFVSWLLSDRLALAGTVIIVAVAVIALYAWLFLDLGVITQSQLGTNPNRTPPSLDYPFGTNGQARNLLPWVAYGAWYTVLFGAVMVAASTVLDVGLGIAVAYYGNVTDNVIMRTMGVLPAFPSLLLALALVAISPDDLGLWRAVAALTLVYTPRFARVVRGAALTVFENEYIDATIALGAVDPCVLVRHVLPNCLTPITVQSTLNFRLAIIDLAALSPPGFGVATGAPSWGLMLSNGVSQGPLIGIWWWSFFPGSFLALMVLGFNLLGDGMHDALDPRMRETVDQPTVSAPPDPTDTASPPVLERAATRFRSVGTATLAGMLAVAIWLIAWPVIDDFSASVETTFAVGSLAFGFGLLGQSGAATLGRGIESMQAHLDTGAGWTRTDAHRAMARVLGFELGVMLGATAIGSVASVFVAA